MCHPLLIGDSTSLTEKSEHAFGVPEKKTGVDNKWITAALSESELEDKFDLDYHFKQVDRIFARVFG